MYFGGNSSARRLNSPCNQPDSLVFLLGSCNGLALVSLDSYENLSIWNPSTGFLHHLHNPGLLGVGDKKICKHVVSAMYQPQMTTKLSLVILVMRMMCGRSGWVVDLLLESQLLGKDWRTSPLLLVLWAPSLPSMSRWRYLSYGKQYSCGDMVYMEEISW